MPLYLGMISSALDSPCQPFSKARDYSGPEDPELSELYLQILRVVQHHHPQYLILENVPNFERHEDGQTWEKVQSLLRSEGYNVSLEKLSPHEFGIPQIRQRVYIVGSLSPLVGFSGSNQGKEACRYIQFWTPILLKHEGFRSRSSVA